MEVVYAKSDGVVEKVQFTELNSVSVIIKAYMGKRHCYSKLTSTELVEGQEVGIGQPIGTHGGNSFHTII